MKFTFSNRFHKDLGAALATGVMLGIAFPPLPFYYFLFVGLTPYLLRLEKKEGLAEINKFTYLTFFIFNLITLYWVGSWTKDADPFLMLSGIALLFFNPLLFLIPSSLYYLTKKFLNRKIAFWLLPVFWVTYEYLYSVTEFRFPWLTLGNGLSEFTAFIQIAEIVGVYGLSILVLFTNLFVARGIKSFLVKERGYKLWLSLALVLFLLILFYGEIRLNKNSNKGREVTVGLIQPDFNPWKKWEAGNLEKQLDIYLNLSRKAVSKGAKIIVWPETALPVYLLSGSYLEYVNEIRAFVDSANVYLIAGMPHAKFYRDSLKAPFGAKRSNYGKYYYTTYNSVLAFQPNTASVQQYGKIKLVPFGEKVPYAEYLPFLENLIKWNVGISSWNTGTDTTVFSLGKSKGEVIKVAPLICIESIYPDFVAQFIKRGAEVISVVTNDSWYGNSSGPYQHKAFAALRAVENRRFLVRAANGGISCIIDDKGRTVKQTKMFERTFLAGKVKLADELTFYTEHPLLFPVSASVISLSVLIFILVKFVFIKIGNGNGKNN